MAHAQLSVSGALPRLRQADVMGLVHHHKAHAPAFGELIGVQHEEFRSGKHDIHRPRCQAAPGLLPLFTGALAIEHNTGDAELQQTSGQVECLVGNEGP